MTPEEQAALDEAAKAAIDDEGPDLEKLQADLAKAQKALKEVNRESAERRKRLEELEKADEARKTAEQTDLEKALKRAEEAEAKAEKAEVEAREMLIRAAFVAEAAKVGAAHPEDVYLLADRSGVDVNDLGAVEGVTEAVKALVDAGRIPLAGKVPAPNLDGGAGGSDRPGQIVRLTPAQEEARRKMGMTPERYRQQLAEIEAKKQEQ